MFHGVCQVLEDSEVEYVALSTPNRRYPSGVTVSHISGVPQRPSTDNSEYILSVCLADTIDIFCLYVNP